MIFRAQWIGKDAFHRPESDLLPLSYRYGRLCDPAAIGVVVLSFSPGMVAVAIL